MSKGKSLPTNLKQGQKYPYKSHYGSHMEMIDAEASKSITDPLFIACQDEYGFYVTERKNLDNGVADPYRFSGRAYRISQLSKHITAEVEKYLPKEEEEVKKTK